MTFLRNLTGTHGDMVFWFPMCSNQAIVILETDFSDIICPECAGFSFTYGFDDRNA